MPRQPLRILVSGASVAGPTTAYWLARQGFAVTVVERMPLTRVRTGGHAVDLFGPAMDVAEEARQQISRYFYECSPEMHAALGRMYVEDERFTAHYERIAPGLAQYVSTAVQANAARQG